MLQLDNLLLAGAIVAGVYVWYRTGFRTPKAIRLPAHVLRRLVIVCGWTLVVGIAIKPVASLFGDGRVQIAKSGKMYAHRTREPMLFWGEIIGEILVIGGVGAAMIFLGRRPALRSAVRDA